MKEEIIAQLISQGPMVSALIAAIIWFARRDSRVQKERREREEAKDAIIAEQSKEMALLVKENIETRVKNIESTNNMVRAMDRFNETMMYIKTVFLNKTNKSK